MKSKKIFLLSTIAVCIYIKTRKPKSKWCKKWLFERKTYSHVNLLNALSLEPADWRNYLRMDEDTYFKLLRLVDPLIKRKNTNMRQCITSHERLSATLRFLASGMSYEDLKYATAISPQALGRIIPDTCKAIMTVLKSYIKMPTITADEWKIVAQGFANKWQFPHCLGAVDGKHVRIVPPPGSGSYFWNYKQFHSMVLMGCANANYEFIWCEFGTNERISDGGVIKSTHFYKQLLENKLNIPDPEKCASNSKIVLPFMFIGDEAFALRSDFLKPYSQKALNYARKIFNYRLSRARKIIENVFGIMANRFRIFRSPINLSLENIEIIVLTCCVLHNFLRTYSTQYLTVDDEIEENSDVFVELETTISKNPSKNAKKVREDFLRYFNGEGKVDWQDDRIK